MAIARSTAGSTTLSYSVSKLTGLPLMIGKLLHNLSYIAAARLHPLLLVWAEKSWLSAIEVRVSDRQARIVAASDTLCVSYHLL